MNRLIRLLTVLTFVSVGLCGIGCRRNSTDRYRPTNATAKKAIETALSTWKEGAKHGPITSVSPNLNVFDARWQAGSRLEDFRILEEVTGKQHPQFKVKLKIEGKPEETIEYLVVGIDPLLVFREADYKRASGL